MLGASTKIIFDSFYLLILCFEKFFTWISRLAFAVYNKRDSKSIY